MVFIKKKGQDGNYGRENGNYYLVIRAQGLRFLGFRVARV